MISCLLIMIQSWYLTFTDKDLFKYPEKLLGAALSEIVFETMLYILLKGY
jgi:hypothetical protein